MHEVRGDATGLAFLVPIAQYDNDATNIMNVDFGRPRLQIPSNCVFTLLRDYD